MKKIAGIMIVSLLIGLAGFNLLEAKKKEYYFLCRHISTPQSLDSIVVKKKKLKNGIQIKMTSNNESKIKQLKDIIDGCLKKASTLTDDSKYPRELLYRKGITCTLTDVKRGFQLEMVSDDPGLIKLIKDVYLPVIRRQDDVTSDVEGTY